VIFGAAAAELGVAEEQAVLAYLQSSLANIVAVAARLIPLGQVEAQRIVRRSWPRLIAATERARSMDREAIGTTMAGLDLASMQHERLHTRLCMS
jgi:urease accessory protein